MAKSTIKDLRNLYGFLLGEDLVKELSDYQINLVSLYYESLSDEEKEKINDAISEGKSHDLLEMAQTLLEESEEKPKAQTKKTGSRKKKQSKQDPPGALVKYEGVDEEDFVTEEIDERVLEILGLPDGVGLTYGEYSTLLKEKLILARGTESQASTVSREENEIIKNALDEVRDKLKKGKDKSDTFKVKSKKISADKFFDKEKSTTLNQTTDKSNQKYLLGNVTYINPKKIATEEKSSDTNSLLQYVIEIRTSVNNILSLLSKQNDLQEKQLEKQRLDRSRRSKRKKEDKLEEIKTAGKNAIKSVIAPVQSILDRIINFITWVVIGRAVTKFLDWASDPKNKQKVEALGNLLKTWWPAILAAFVLFTTPLGKFIRVIVGTIAKLTFQLLRKGIPALKRFLGERNKGRNRITNDSQRGNRRRGGTPSRTPSRTPGRTPGRTPRVRGRGGLIGTLGFLGLEMATPFLSEKVGDLYSNLKIGDRGLSDDDLLREYKNEKEKIERRSSGPLGDLIQERTDYSRLEGLEQELNKRGIPYRNGGQIYSRYTGGGSINLGGAEAFSGVVTKNDGERVTGAGRDTQAFDIAGGGKAVLQPGELVLNEQQQKNMERDTGIDPKSYVANARPQQTAGIRKYSTGGIIENKQSPIRKKPKFNEPYSEKEGYGNNNMMDFSSVKGLQGGGFLSWWPFGGKKDPSKKAVGALQNAAQSGNLGGLTQQLDSRRRANEEAMKMLNGYQGGGEITRRQNGGPLTYSRGTNQFGEVPLIRAALSSGIKGPELAAFLAQMSHETGGFKWSRELGRGEGMGYSGGSKYHGRGYTQLTHDYNYRDFGNKLGVDLLKDPDLLIKDPNLSARVAIEYWKQRVRPSVKDWNDVFAHSSAINYPAASSPAQINGYEDRLKKFNYYKKNLELIISRSLPQKPPPKAKPKPKSLMDNVSGFLSGLGSLFTPKSALAKPKKKIGGGGNITPITTQTGYDITGGKMGADTQYLPQYNTAFQPGEELFKFVITKDAAEKGLGQELLSFANQRQAQLDSNSNAANVIPNRKPTIPGKRVKSNNSNAPIVLPPINQVTGNRAKPIEINGTEVPDWPIVSPYSKRSDLLANYGVLTSSLVG